MDLILKFLSPIHTPIYYIYFSTMYMMKETIENEDLALLSDIPNILLAIWQQACVLCLASVTCDQCFITAIMLYILPL